MTQGEILRAGLTAGAAIDRSGQIVDLPWRWRDDEWKADPLSWSRKRQERGQTGVAAGDTRTERSPEPRYQHDRDRQAAEARPFDDLCLDCLGLSHGPGH